MSEADLHDLPAANPHGTIRRISEDVYYVEGDVTMGPFVVPRGMAIIRDSSTNGLTLINAIRLTPSGESALLELGAIKHVLRIGYHDMDTAYYVRKFGAVMTGYPSVPYAHGVTPDRDILRDGLPFPNGEIVDFEHLPKQWAECAVLVKRPGGNILVTGDAVQSWPKPVGNWWARNVLWIFGFSGIIVFGYFWVRTVKKAMEDPSLLRCDYEKLIGVDFTHLLSAHGCIIGGSPREDFAKAFQKEFPE